jgi:prepilin-type N-terminal cleavage/methylation domain-containing protein
LGRSFKPFAGEGAWARAFTLIELLVVIAILAGFTLKSDEPFAFTAPGLLGSKFSEV